MKYLHWSYLRIIIDIITGIFIGTGIPGIPEAQESMDYSSEDVIVHVYETYQKVHSARGKITRIVESGSDEAKFFTGSFAVRKPDRLLLEFVGEIHQFIGFNTTMYRVYFPEGNKGFFLKTDDMIAMERFILGPEPFFGNILTLLEEDFNIEITNRIEGNIVLKAIPPNPVHFNYILVGVDPETWTIKAVEYFDRNNELIFQVRYLEFKSSGDSLLFPAKIVTSTLLDSTLTVETTYLTRVRLNVKIDDSNFVIPSNEQTEWIAQPGTTRH